MSRNRRLSARQELFAVEYAKGLNATHAAIQAGYSPRFAAVAATRLLKNSRVIERVLKEFNESHKDAEDSADHVLREIAKLASATIDDYITINDDGPFFLDPCKLAAGKPAGVADIRVTKRVVGKGKHAREITRTSISFPQRQQALKLLVQRE